MGLGPIIGRSNRPPGAMTDYRPIPLLDEVALEKFLNSFEIRRVNPSYPTRCWVWTETLFGEGYGDFCFAAGNWLAHRISYELFNGVPICPGMTIDHLCNVRECVNPDHLEMVSLPENARRQRSRMDMCRSGRHAMPTIGRCEPCYVESKRKANKAAKRRKFELQLKKLRGA